MCTAGLKVEVEVPSSLVSSAVRFKWKQENFENALEFWALDNVQVRVKVLGEVVGRCKGFTRVMFYEWYIPN